MTNFRYLLAFNRMPQVGPRTVKKLEQHTPDLSCLFKQSTAALEKQGLSTQLAQNIAEFDFKKIDDDLTWEQSSPNNHIITWESPDYPSLLSEIADPPLILYAQGQLSSFNNPSIAIIGTRNPTITGIENAKSFSKALATQGLTIVSGLALGIDAQAHIGCLEAKGQTIAVLGTGLDCIYPRRHCQLAEQIRINGLLISEFPLKSPPIAGHFPRRNRIISGLTLCTLVVEAALKSGSLITARMAMEQNRDVLAIPGSIHNPLASGCHHLLQQGAKLITSVQDILDEFGLDNSRTGDLSAECNSRAIGLNSADKLQGLSEQIPGRFLKITEKSAVPLATEQENLVKFIDFEMTTIDKIIGRSGYTIEQVTCKLAQLELEGTVLSVPGGYIRR